MAENYAKMRTPNRNKTPKKKENNIFNWFQSGRRVCKSSFYLRGQSEWTRKTKILYSQQCSTNMWVIETITHSYLNLNFAVHVIYIWFILWESCCTGNHFLKLKVHPKLLKRSVIEAPNGQSLLYEWCSARRIIGRRLDCPQSAPVSRTEVMQRVSIYLERVRKVFSEWRWNRQEETVRERSNWLQIIGEWNGE